MSSFIEKTKPYFRILEKWNIDEILSEYFREILLFVILSLAGINLGIFLIVYKYFYSAEIYISGWYLFLFVFSLCIEILGGITLIRQKEKRKSDSDNQTLPLRETVPSGFPDIFSQIVDPVGELHVWRMKNDYLLIQAENAIAGSMMLTYEQIAISNGIRQVIYLEDFLSRHCNIELIGKYGERTNFDQKLHVVDEIYEKNISVKSGEIVSIVSPGWRWFDVVIRYPRVK